MRVRTFQGLVPAPKFAAEVAAVPYDVVNRDEAYELAKDNAINLLHVDRAEIDLDPNIDPYSAPVYAKALETFKELQTHGVLVRERPVHVCVPARQWARTRRPAPQCAVCHTEDYRGTSSRNTRRPDPTKKTTARGSWTR